MTAVTRTYPRDLIGYGARAPIRAGRTRRDGRFARAQLRGRRRVVRTARRRALGVGADGSGRRRGAARCAKPQRRIQFRIRQPRGLLGDHAPAAGARAWRRPCTPWGWRWSAIPRPPRRSRGVASKSPATASAGSTISSCRRQWSAQHMRRNIEAITRMIGRRRSAGIPGARARTRDACWSSTADSCTTATRTTMTCPTGCEVSGHAHLVVPYSFDTNDSRLQRGGDFSYRRGVLRLLPRCIRLAVSARVADGRPRMMTIGLHGRIIGRPGRIGALAAAARAHPVSRWRLALQPRSHRAALDDPSPAKLSAKPPRVLYRTARKKGIHDTEPRYRHGAGTRCGAGASQSGAARQLPHEPERQGLRRRPLPGRGQPGGEALLSRGYRLQQLPCPELAFAGARRWWAVYEQYDTPAYRAHCRRLAQAIAPLIEQYLRRGDEVILIGLDGSPSTGVRFTSSKPDWGGRPNRPEDDWEIVPRRGVWIEELEAELARRGLPAVPATGWALDMGRFDEAGARARPGTVPGPSGGRCGSRGDIRRCREPRCTRLAHGAGARHTHQSGGPAPARRCPTCGAYWRPATTECCSYRRRAGTACCSP